MTIADFTDDQLLAAYQRHGNVWLAAEELGVRGQSLHRRLQRRGWNNSRPEEFTDNEQATIRAAYEAGFLAGDGTLDSLAKLIGKSKQNTPNRSNPPMTPSETPTGVSEAICRVSSSNPDCETNAARIVACWNACVGINPEAVPDLLEACRAARVELAWIIDQVKATPGGSVDRAFKKCTDAYTKATGATR